MVAVLFPFEAVMLLEAGKRIPGSNHLGWQVAIRSLVPTEYSVTDADHQAINHPGHHNNPFLGKRLR
jgi:hypothetical protein